MQPQPWNVLLPLILVWVVSGLAGISFLWQAFTEKPRQTNSRWRRQYQEIRFRLLLTAGAGLLLWVISGIVTLIIQ